MGKGKAHRPYEFGVKVSIATTNRRCKGGEFVLHARAFHGNPYDGHTLGSVIEETRALTVREIERVYADKGYRGHDAPKPLRVFISGRRRGVHGQIKHELRRRSAIDAADGHLSRNFLTGRHGDQVHAVLTAVGLKPPPHPQLAAGSLAQKPGGDHGRSQPVAARKPGFLTVNSFRRRRWRTWR
ncbi:MAG: transposase [Alphaproteobacteria bacterium]|nr:transposase [Alphaproteobacteria bacterium]